MDKVITKSPGSIYLMSPIMIQIEPENLIGDGEHDSDKLYKQRREAGIEMISLRRKSR